MLQIQCDKCKQKFWVKGYTTPDGLYEPGEVVIEPEATDDLCECLKDDGDYTIVDEEYEYFGDEVI